MALLRRYQQDPKVKIYFNGINWCMKFTHKDLWWGPFDSRRDAKDFADYKGYDIAN